MLLRTVLLRHTKDEDGVGTAWPRDAHSCELRRRTASDLLYAEGAELLLELDELLQQVTLIPARIE